MSYKKYLTAIVISLPLLLPVSSFANASQMPAKEKPRCERAAFKKLPQETKAQVKSILEKNKAEMQALHQKAKAEKKNLNKKIADKSSSWEEVSQLRQSLSQTEASIALLKAKVRYDVFQTTNFLLKGPLKPHHHKHGHFKKG